jgi:hypothetical protein
VSPSVSPDGCPAEPGGCTTGITVVASLSAPAANTDEPRAGEDVSAASVELAAVSAAAVSDVEASRAGPSDACDLSPAGTIGMTSVTGS